MATSPNLEITHIVSSQAQKEVTANAAFDALDKALCQFTEIELDDADLTLTDAQLTGSFYLQFTGTLTEARAVTIPAMAKPFVAENATDGDFSLTLATDGGTDISLASGEIKFLYCDGDDLIELVTTGLGQPYDIGGTFPGAPEAGVTILRYPMPRAVRFEAGLSGSQGVAGTAPTADASFSLQKSGASFATMDFAASSATATFTCESDTDFAAGDILTLVAPSPADDTLADIGFSFSGIKL